MNNKFNKTKHITLPIITTEKNTHNTHFILKSILITFFLKNGNFLWINLKLILVLSLSHYLVSTQPLKFKIN